MRPVLLSGPMKPRWSGDSKMSPKPLAPPVVLLSQVALQGASTFKGYLVVTRWPLEHQPSQSRSIWEEEGRGRVEGLPAG